MNNEVRLHYIETDETPDSIVAKPSRTKSILSLCFGIASILLGGIVGIVLGVLARRFASPILLDFAGTLEAKLARVGKITGTVGVALAVIGACVIVLAVAAIVALIVMIMPTVNVGEITM